jgi:hypothetical protein
MHGKTSGALTAVSAVDAESAGAPKVGARRFGPPHLSWRESNHCEVFQLE